MQLAHLEVPESQSSAWGSVALGPLQSRQPGLPGLNWVCLAASTNAAGAVFRPPHGFVRFCILRFLPARHVSRVKKSVTTLFHGKRVVA